MTRLIGVLVLAAFVAACGSAADEGDRELAARVAALEQRVAAPASAPASAAGGGTQRLESDVKALERRLAALESEVVALVDELAYAEGGPDSIEGGGRTRPRRPRPTREERRERRTKLRELSVEYRERLGQLRQQYSDDPRDPERQEAIREVLDWYRAERRTILRGEEPG